MDSIFRVLNESGERWLLFVMISFYIILAYTQVRLCVSLTVGWGLLVSHGTVVAHRPIITASQHFQAREGEVEWASQGLCTQLCKYLKGGYLKCTGALLPAPFEGLNEGLKGWTQRFSPCVCVRACAPACTSASMPEHFSGHAYLRECECTRAGSVE